jgi:hypothetical protein
VAAQVVPPSDAHVCALVAWVAYARGEGALANVALDRALAGQPDHSLALLLRSCLDAGLPPGEIRSMARATEQVLRRRTGPRRLRAGGGALGGLADRAHVEVGHAQRRHPHPREAVAPLRGRAATLRPTSESRPSRSTGLSFQRKLFTAPTTSPPSTR